MKKINLLFLLLLSSVFLHGQEYLPILEENRVWSIMHEKHALLGDTMINETTYKKLFYHSYIEEFTPDSLQYIAAMREDSLNEKVYFIWKNHEDEVLLYDFSLEVGNTFEVNSPFLGLGEPTYIEDYFNQRILEVAQISETVIGGEARKTIHLTRYEDPSFGEYWIEGIGSSVGLIYAGYFSDPIMDAPYPFLLCVHEDSILMYQEDDPWGLYMNTCYAEPTTNVDEIEVKSYGFNVWPTFFKEQIFLQSNSQAFKVSVYDLTGRMIYQYHSLESLTELTIPTIHWESGLYVIKMSNPDSYVTKKVIKLKD